MKNILITICGREGSKGVENKNIRNFNGMPLIMYTINQAEVFKEVISEYEVDIAINSDSEKILEIARQKNCYVVERKKGNATDTAPKVPVIINTLEKMEQKTGKKYMYVLDLDITSPLRRISDIKKGLERIETNNFDCIFSVVPARRNPYFNMVEKKDGKVKKIVEQEYFSRQTAPEVFDMNASIYFYKGASLGNEIKKLPFDGKYDFFIMKDYGIIDIDNEEDFYLTELIYKKHFMDSHDENKKTL